MSIQKIAQEFYTSDYMAERTANRTEDREVSRQDMMQLISETAKELAEKIKNGETETSYPIGANSFTEKEWNTFLAGFDRAQEKLRKLTEEEIEKREEERAKRELAEKKNIAYMGDIRDEEIQTLVSENTICADEAGDEDGEKQWYITMYTEKGIYCSKLGKIGEKKEYLWVIEHNDPLQYKRILDFLDTFEKGDDMSFARSQSFWQAFLDGEPDASYMGEGFE